MAKRLEPAAEAGVRKRLRVSIRGAVQGVGFRPFIHRLAHELNLAGWVTNGPGGVELEAEGPLGALLTLRERLALESPAPAIIQRVESSFAEPVGHDRFEIRASDHDGERTAWVLPDLATCDDCLADMLDPGDRRYRYPFTNCTRCGPRYTIIQSIPYDRPNTTMARFVMCPACRREYEDPSNRRFHAQPNACPMCGPSLEWWDERGAVRAAHDDALRAAADAIRAGEIVAVKGIGGFHLVVDARNERAVRRLRERKHREEKPLAVMMPSIEMVRRHCRVTAVEARLMTSTAAPIVLLRKRDTGIRESIGDVAPTPMGGSDGAALRHTSEGGADSLAASVAPGNPRLGVMLPYSPLHHLLMRELAFPIVATSGNLSDEPICTDEREARDRLGGVADRFLVHNRPIVRPVDDSVARVVMGKPMLLRRARGYAPLPVGMATDGEPVLAVGAHLKCTVALGVGKNVYVSQHLGDLETRQGCDAFEEAVDSIQRLYESRPRIVACDLHPDYVSTRLANQISTDPVRIQHHHAHVAACMAEHELNGEVLGICWDGAGLGSDGTIWGSEFLRATVATFRRLGHIRTLALPGGDRAAREPRRSAFSLLYETFGESVCSMDDLPPVRAFSMVERKAIVRMIERRVQAPQTAGMGRLFDAVASLLDLRQTMSFEGQAAMEVEFAANSSHGAPLYAMEVCENAAGWTVDWRPMIRAIVRDVRAGEPKARIAAGFHGALVNVVADIARAVGLGRVILTGGCFQNMRLLVSVARRLRGSGFEVYWPRQVPCNDGGISLGQAAAARAIVQARESIECA